MKKILALGIVLVGFAGCSNPNYKKTAVKFLKEQLPDKVAVDTVHFFKPDSISTSLIDDITYRKLRYQRDSLLEINYPKEAARFTDLMAERAKTYKKTLTGWDVRLIYKTRDKAGNTNTDTCRFVFNVDKNLVKFVSGPGIPPGKF